MSYVRVPIYYMGNKYNLLEDLIRQFPGCGGVATFFDVFGGSGNVALNVPYKHVVYNELNKDVFGLFKTLLEVDCETILSHIKNVSIEDEEDYYRFRDEFNKKWCRKEEKAQGFLPNQYYLDLFTLTFFSFSNQMRFNSDGQFNMPYGKRCFSLESEHKIRLFKNHIDGRLRRGDLSLELRNEDAFVLLENVIENSFSMSSSFFYLDPPYLGTTAVYNEKYVGDGVAASRRIGTSGWGSDDDARLFHLCDRINDAGGKFAMSNVAEVRGKKSEGLLKWAKERGYNVIYFSDKNYAAMGKGNAQAVEILIVNYKPKLQQLSIFDV